MLRIAGLSSKNVFIVSCAIALAGCLPILDATSGCQGTGAEGNACQSSGANVTLNINLIDNHGESVVASRIAIIEPSNLVTSTDSNGNFSLANYNLSATLLGNISSVTAPAGQSRFYITSVSTPSTTNPTQNGSLSSFGYGVTSNFTIQTAIQNNTLTVTYPRVVHYECAMPFNNGGAILQCAGPMIRTNNVAQDFALTSNESICRVGMQATFSGFNSTGPTAPYSVHMRLRSDNGGVPGSIIADSITRNSSVGSNPEANVIGVDASGAGWGLTASFVDFCANGGPKISLNSGERYWIEMALVGVDMSYDPEFTILDMASCPLPSGGLPMQTSPDDVNWSPLTVSDPGSQGCGTSQNVPIFLAE